MGLQDATTLRTRRLGYLARQLAKIMTAQQTAREQVNGLRLGNTTLTMGSTLLHGQVTNYVLISRLANADPLLGNHVAQSIVTWFISVPGAWLVDMASTLAPERHHHHTFLLTKAKVNTKVERAERARVDIGDRPSGCERHIFQ